MDDENDVLDLDENASKSSINDLVQDIRDKKIVFADITQDNRQNHKFYIKGVPEISGGDILIRNAHDYHTFIQIKIELIKDIKRRDKAVSIYLKK